MLSIQLRNTIAFQPIHVVESLDYVDLLGLLYNLKDLQEYDLFNLLYAYTRIRYSTVQVDLINYEHSENILLEIGIN